MVRVSEVYMRLQKELRSSKKEDAGVAETKNQGAGRPLVARLIVDTAVPRRRSRRLIELALAQGFVGIP